MKTKTKTKTKTMKTHAKCDALDREGTNGRALKNPKRRGVTNKVLHNYSRYTIRESEGVLTAAGGLICTRNGNHFE